MLFHRRSSSHKSFFLGACVGGIVGGLTALFLAPQSGTKLRKSVAKQCHVASHKAEGLLKEARKRSSRLVKEAHTLAREVKKKLK